MLVVLAIAGFWVTTQQEQSGREVEEQRAEAEREFAGQRAQDAALQAYLDRIGSLLLTKNGGLRDSEEGRARAVGAARLAGAALSVVGDSIYTFFLVHGEKLLKARFLEKISA